MPTPEDVPAEPMSAYGLSKLSAEHYARWFRRMRGLDVVTLRYGRYGNVYGPRQDARSDAGVIAIFCDRALAGQRPIVYGDGRQTRDFIFVADIVQANLAAGAVTTLSHTEYNIGTGTEASVLELARAIATAAGVHPTAFGPSSRQPAPASCYEAASTSVAPSATSTCRHPHHSQSGWLGPSRRSNLPIQLCIFHRVGMGGPREGLYDHLRQARASLSLCPGDRRTDMRVRIVRWPTGAKMQKNRLVTFLA